MGGEGATRSSGVDFLLRADKQCALNGLFISWTNVIRVTEIKYAERSLL